MQQPNIGFQLTPLGGRKIVAILAAGISSTAFPIKRCGAAQRQAVGRGYAVHACQRGRMTVADLRRYPGRNRKDDVMMQATAHLYIVTDNQILNGEPIIKGTRTPVRAIVEIWRQGVPPEAIPNQLPHLTLAQVFDALSYYSDNQDEINQHIARNRIPDDLIDPLVK
jgi:uncharacterized protein (DUF433 family)